MGSPGTEPGRPEIARAVEVFVRGFAYTRSLTHPYVPERVGPAWALRDAPRRNAKPYRREEWVAHGVDPAELHELAATKTRGRYALCVVRDLDEPAGPIREAYKRLGYRLQTTEPLMVHRLRRVPRFAGPAVSVRRVGTAALAERLAAAAKTRPLSPDDLDADSPLRQYVAMEDGTPVGWVQSIAVGDATWCADMFVLPSHRRRGIGRSMLVRMLRDDRGRGAAASVLTASHTGALLYPVVGYDQIGELLMYTPRRPG